MNSFKNISLLFVLVALFASCQSNQTKQDSEVQSSDKTAEITQDYSFQLKLAENALVYPFEQKALGYTYNALEPYIDKETMEVHYSKHHAGYTAKFNTAIQENKLESMPLFAIFEKISTYPVSVRNNSGGYYNHLLFWQVMAPNAGGEPTGDLAEAIKSKFGSFDEFKSKFSEASKGIFGSGWSWLSVNTEGELFISTTPNQDNPLMDVVKKRGIPVLCLDVWEHAYYLKYQNKRPDYINNFWNVVEWREVERRYDEAIKVVK